MNNQEQLALVFNNVQNWKKLRKGNTQNLDLPTKPSLFPEGKQHLCPSGVDVVCAVSIRATSG